MRGSINERYEYQQYIIDRLKNDGYLERDADDFDRLHAMDPELLLKFLKATQPKEFASLKKMYGDDLPDFIVNSVNKAATDKNGSMLDLLKHGIDIANHHLTLFYNKPATDFNPDLIKKYQNNIFSVMQEVWATDDERVDLVLFINGIAVISFELKSNTQHQDYRDAIMQYRKDRDPKARLFLFKAGCLVNFAMDLNEVYMTTKLEGNKTYFMPFNQGKGSGVDSGAGNPVSKNGEFSVSYMWNDILTKDTLTELIEKFIFIETKKKTDELTHKIKTVQRLIFPRYHQLDAIRKILADLKINHTSQNYLIEHSAGSGKTNTIAWLASRLTSLHDDENKQIFDNIIIMTDRVVVDRQLQQAMKRIDIADGVIQTMDEDCNSADLERALASNTKVVVTTIQKFPYVLNIIKDAGNNGPNLKNKKFAVIIDEAHSSTAGKNMLAVTQTLSADDEKEEPDLQDMLTQEIKRSGKQSNVSMFAFTATPKATTLRLFGRPDKYGNYKAFHLYSMKQAIEEGFILDVLSHYITYKTFYKLNKNIHDDPNLNTADAKRQITNFIDLNDKNIEQRTEIIVDHFKNHVVKELNGNAKAMVITASRKAAVKYQLAFENYISEHGYDDIKTLVAFSGSVKLNDKEYTEASMNGFSEDRTPKEFNKPNCNMLIVANKYQVGFDQPKLTAMYVMKKLRGVNAVQTLSRLNRVCPPYDKTPVVLDFANDYKDIEAAFQPYYTTTFLANTINPATIHNLDEKIDGYYIINPLDVEDVNILIHKQHITFKDKQNLNFYFAKTQKEVEKLEKHEQAEFLKLLKHFCRYYEFLLQVSSLEDIELQKKYNYISYLLKYINISNPGEGYDLTGKLKADGFRQKRSGDHQKEAHKSNPVLNLPNAEDIDFSEPTKKRLSTIIEEINNRTGANFDEDVTTKSLLQVKDIMLKDPHLKESAKNNTESDFELAYFDQVNKSLIKGLSQNKDFFTYLLNTPEIRKEVMGIFAQEIYKALRKE